MNGLTIYNVDRKEARTTNIGLAIVGQTVVNSIFLLLLGIYANVGLKIFISATFAKS